MTTDPKNNEPLERDPESDIPSTRKEKITEQKLVEMTRALEQQDQAKAEKIAEQLVEMWQPNE